MGSKMRMVYPYPKGRRFQDEDRVSFKSSEELKLRDTIPSQKSIKPIKCLHELGLLLTCLKENRFLEKECINETNDYYMCSRKHNLAGTREAGTEHKEKYAPKSDVKRMNEIFKKYKK